MAAYGRERSVDRVFGPGMPRLTVHDPNSVGRSELLDGQLHHTKRSVAASRLCCFVTGLSLARHADWQNHSGLLDKSTGEKDDAIDGVETPDQGDGTGLAVLREKPASLIRCVAMRR